MKICPLYDSIIEFTILEHFLNFNTIACNYPTFPNILQKFF